MHGHSENVMQDEPPISPRIEIRASRCRRHALRALALLAGAVGTPTLAGTVQGTALYRERIALPQSKRNGGLPA